MVMKNRIISFDVIRGLSAISVMLYHYTCRYNEIPELQSSSTDFEFSITWGFAAVSSFFILSGFFSARQLYDNQAYKWGYIINRLKRLYPAFFISVFITFITTRLFLPELSCSYKDFILNLSMIPGPLGAKPVDGAYWTLFVEWIFYFFVAALLIKPNKKITNMSLILWMIISICSYLIAGSSPSGVFRVINYCLVTSYSSCFVTGIALYLFAKKKHDYYTYIYISLAFINVFLWQNTPNIIFYFLTCVLVFVFTHVDIEDKLANNRLARICAWYGKISYPFYLLHQVVGYVIIFYLVEAGFNKAVILLVPFIIITLSAYLINKCSNLLFQKKYNSK